MSGSYYRGFNGSFLGLNSVAITSPGRFLKQRKYMTATSSSKKLANTYCVTGTFTKSSSQHLEVSPTGVTFYR